MKALIVYDSFFGNTEQVAQAMGRALEGETEVQVVRVNQVKPEQLVGLDLLLVGSPTRGFRPSPGTTEWLKSIPAAALRGVRVAAFDTRVAPEDIPSRPLRFLVSKLGYAAPAIASALQKAGGELALPPEGFLVQDREGPLKPGEADRAAHWAREALSGLLDKARQRAP